MNWEIIDKFYLVLTLVLVLMSVMVIFSFRGIFSAFLTAYELDQSEITTQAKVDKEKLDEASSWISGRESVILQVN